MSGSSTARRRVSDSPARLPSPADNARSSHGAPTRVDRFLAAAVDHRRAIGFRLGVLYGLRRSEVLALRWDDLDTDTPTVRIDESLVAVRTGASWSNAKNERSRRVIPVDDNTIKAFARRRTEQDPNG